MSDKSYDRFLSWFIALLVLMLFVGLIVNYADGQTYALAPVPRLQFLNSNGQPLSGGLIYSYGAGTSTPLATYTDSTGGTPNTNPVVLDAGGFASIWLGPVKYKFVVADQNNVVQYTVDNVSSTNLPLTGTISFTAQSAPSCVSTNYILWADTSNTRIRMCNNGNVDTLIGQNTTDTLANKVLTAPVINNATLNSPTISGSLPSLTVSGASTLGTVSASTIRGDLTIGTALDAYGDSFTAGHGLSSPSTQAYPALLAAAKGWTLSNHAVDGSMCMDQADSYITSNPSVNSISTIMLGYNDMRVNGSDATKQYEFQRCITAAAAWRATLPAERVVAQSAGCVVSGTAVNTPVWAGIGKDLTANATTLTCTTPPGTTVIAYSLAQVNNTGTFTITIDTVSYGTFSNTGHVTNIAGTRSFAPAAYRFPGLANKPHTVVFTATSTDASVNTVHILGVSVASPAIGAKTGPWVYLSTIARDNSTGYATTCSPTNCNNGSDAIVGQYNNSIYHAVCGLSSDGLNVGLVDVTNDQSFNPNDASQIQSDNVHPTAAGQVNLGTSFINRATLSAYPGNPGCEQNASFYGGSLYMGGGTTPANTPFIGELGTNTQTGSNYGATGTVRFGSDTGGISRNGNAYTVTTAVGTTTLTPISGATVTQTVGTGNVTTAGTAVTNGTCQAQTGITVTGAATTDSVVPNIGATLPATWQTGIQLVAHVTATNTVTVYLCNPSAGSITPAATQVNVRVIR